MKIEKSTKHSCRMIRRAPRRRSIRARSHRIPAIPTPPPSIESPPPSPRSISSLSTLIIEPRSPISVSSWSTVDYEPSPHPPRRSSPSLRDQYDRLSPDSQLRVNDELQREMLELFNLWSFRRHTHTHNCTLPTNKKYTCVRLIVIYCNFWLFK